MSIVKNTSFVPHSLFIPPWAARWLLTLTVAVVLTVFFNQGLWNKVMLLGGWQLTLPLGMLLLLINILLCQLLSIGYLQKIWLMTLLSIAAGSQYFMQHYGVLIDNNMLVNALETDAHEVNGLLSYTMLPYFTLYLLCPLSVLVWVKVHRQPLLRMIKQYVIICLISILLIAGLVLTQYQSYAGLFREHRDLKYQAVPLNVIAASVSLIKTKMEAVRKADFQLYATDAVQIQHQGKPRLIIMVLGETIRADHLGINGYSRDTTPKLSARSDIINFGAINACGTATAISVPCMFSYLEQASYDESIAKNSDNLLDVLARAGVKVLWRDNNSGCKSVCDRVEVDPFIAEAPEKCVTGECPDSALLHNLSQKILASTQANQDIFVVLHQQGAHGPEYFKRSVTEQKLFLPECQHNLLNKCDRQHIVNAYDNAVVATDSLLDSTITLLQQLNDKFDTAMLYVSDHGESLGENGVYLHGLPYWMAPEAQTKVPLLMWLSDDYKQTSAIDTDCLKHINNLSHDYLFHSVLSLYDINTQAKDRNLDILNTCTSKR